MRFCVILFCYQFPLIFMKLTIRTSVMGSSLLRTKLYFVLVRFVSFKSDINFNLNKGLR